MIEAFSSPAVEAVQVVNQTHRGLVDDRVPGVRSAGYRAFVPGRLFPRSFGRDVLASDLDTQGLILAFTLNMATPETPVALMGNGDSDRAQGLYLSVRPSGRLRVVSNTSAGFFGGLSDSIAAVADGSDHTVAIVVDGPTKTITVYIDGRLDTVYPQAFRGAAAPTSAWNIGRSGGRASGRTVAAGGIANFHALVFDRGLPGNIGQIALRLHTAPAIALQDNDIVRRRRTVAVAIDGQSNEAGVASPDGLSGDFGMPAPDQGGRPGSMWPTVVAAAGQRGAWMNVYNGALGTTSQADSWVGVVRAWSPGIRVMRGTYLLSGDQIYKCTGAPSTIFVATTRPTGAAAIQTGADGVQWTRMGAARAQDTPGYVYPHTDAYFDPNGYLAADLAGVQPLLRNWFPGIRTRRGQYVLSAGAVYRNDFVANPEILSSTVQPAGPSPAMGADSVPWTWMGPARAQDVAGYVYPSTDAYAAMQGYDARIVFISIGQGDRALAVTREQYARSLINAADYFLAHGVKVAIGFTVYSGGPGTEAWYQSELLPGWRDALDHYAGNPDVIAGANLRTALGVLPVTPPAGPGLKADKVHMNDAAYALGAQEWSRVLALAGVI